MWHVDKYAILQTFLVCNYLLLEHTVFGLEIYYFEK